jgi:hypothetical protein
LILAGRVEQLPADIPWVAFQEVTSAPNQLPIGEALRPHRERLRADFVDWLGGINSANASRAWWAHGTSAKNLLSSPFGNQVFELLGLRLLIEASGHARIGVVGASAAQAESLSRWAQRDRSLRVVDRRSSKGSSPFPAVPRMFYQFLRVLFAWAWWLRGMRTRESSGIHVLTYADKGFHDGDDAFFGPLAALLAKQDPPIACHYHVVMHGAYRKVAPLLRASQHGYAPILSELSAGDILGAFGDSVAALGRVGHWTQPGNLDGFDLEPLLRAALREDVAGGGYFQNLLVGRAALRLGRRLHPGVFLYPYENKSLEKLLLLGLRAADSSIRLAGYQHTSVTPRHTTLLFAAGEAERTPLPDRIVTCGGVTIAYLEAHGRYPAGLLVEGFALRQPQRARFGRRIPDKAMRILLALSSSAMELRDAALLLLAAAERKGDWQLAVRPHPEFPIALLPQDLRSRLGARVLDFSGSPLEENLAWADVVVYASSTVGLEALMAGRPVVNLDLGESLDSDPVLEQVALHWRAQCAADLVVAIDAISSLDDKEYAARQAAARAFTGRYFRALSEQRLGMLVKIPRQ